MKTRDFIRTTFATESNRERMCSSVYTNSQGTVFSYGRHYPLLFQIKGHNFINTRGYSITTTRHISWAWSAVDYNATAVELDNHASDIIADRYNSDEVKLKSLLRCATQTICDLEKSMQQKTRKNTYVYRDLANQWGKANAAAIAISNLLTENNTASVAGVLEFAR